MKKIVLKFILSLILILQCNCSFAQEPVLDTVLVTPSIPEHDNYVEEPFDTLRPTFTATITESQQLPPQLYGTWQVTQNLVATNAPIFFKQRTSDIWIIRQEGDKVRLNNPDTGGESIITINDVVDNNATFTCTFEYENKKFKEQPNITVINDSFVGNNIYQIIIETKSGKKYTFQAELEMQGTKISGPTPTIFRKDNSFETRN